MTNGVVTAETVWLEIGPVGSFDQPGGTTAEVNGRTVAVFRTGDGWRVVDDSCPHQGASLATGTHEEGVVTCPLHQWQFDLNSGECLDHPARALRTYRVEEREDVLWVEDPASGESEKPGCLVRYGALGWVGHFSHEPDAEIVHGQRVVVKSDRGLELGEALSKANSGGLSDVMPAGEIVRVATAEDCRHVPSAVSEMEALEVLAAEQEVPIEAVDGELLLDGETVLVYCLGEMGSETVGLGRTLSEQTGRRVELVPLIDPEPSGGCGSGGGGCGQPGCGGGGGGDDEAESE